MSEIKIGDMLWSDNDFGRRRWVHAQITGETKLSWLYGDRQECKINKKTMQEAQPRFLPRQWYSEQQKIDKDFCDRWAHDIGGQVDICKDVDKLKKIAAIIGMELK